jgi:hypothetical protein
MSLHKFAEQVASQGRGDDSLLVHMTPDEVRNLQKFAEANGTTLTINPTTGLPEAGLLSDLFKSIAPIALGAFLGPAGFGLSASMAGLATGGITALATGSLSRGLMAGLGAYGGAGLGDSLMTAGGGMSAANAATTAQQQLSGANLALGEAMPAQVAEQFTKDAVTRMTPSGAVSAGFNKAIASPTAAMDFAKNNLTNIGMAAAPIMAGAMVPTTTEMPDPKDRYIRMMDYNINPDTGKPDPLYGMREMTPIKTSDFKGKTFQSQRDLFRQQNPNPYELGVGSLNQPPQQQPARMNTGGIVALAAGGPPTMMTDEQLYQKTGSWEAAAAARDAQNNALNAFNNQQAANARDNINNSLNQVDWRQQAENRDAAANAANAANFAKNPDASDWWAKQPGGVDALYSTINQQLASNPNMTDAQIDAAMKQYGISNEDVAAALRKGGGSQAQEYSMLAGNMGLSGLNTNINDWIAKARQDPTFRAKTGLQQQEAAMAAMGTVNMNEADVLRATGKTIAELFPSTLTKPISVIPGGTQLPGATVYDNGAYGNYGSGPATGVDYLGRTVSIATPGDIITNPDGTVTVVPNIPGRPYGGFTGMDQVKSRYTAGGGSLGYTAPIPKDPEATFNKMTDDSLDAYNFLMGKGKNLSQRTATADRPAMRRYDEAVLGRKIPKLTKPGTTTTKTDTKETVAGNTATSAVVGGERYDLTDPTKAPPEDNNGPWQWDPANKMWIQAGRAAAGGLQNSYANGGYAMGGGLGSLGSYSDGGRLLKGPGDGVSDSIPATIGRKQQPARLADGEFVIPARIVSELGNGSTDAGAKKLYAMMDRVQRARRKTTGKNKVAANSRADKYLPA